MAPARRILRTTQQARLQLPDEQLWPLVLSFCVLGGFLAGVVLAYLRLDDPRWYANARTYLIAIPCLIALALLVLAATGNRLLCRTMQLALVLCIVFHIMFVMVALHTDVFRHVWTEVLVATRPPPEPEVVKVPEYASQQDARLRARQSVDQLLETRLPDPATASISREMAGKEPLDVELQSPGAPQVQDVALPDVVRRPELHPTVPRQREQRSQLSRREADLSLQSSPSVPVPWRLEREERHPEAVDPVEARTPKEHIAVPFQPATIPAVAPQPSTSLPSSGVREPVTLDAPQLAAGASRPRSESRSAIRARADASVEERPPAAPRTEPDSAQPHNTAALRQPLPSPQRPDPSSPPAHAPSDDTDSRQRSAQRPAETRPVLTQTPHAIASPRARSSTGLDTTPWVEMPPRTAEAQPPRPADPLAERAASLAESDRWANTVDLRRNPAAVTTPAAPALSEAESNAGPVAGSALATPSHSPDQSHQRVDQAVDALPDSFSPPVGSLPKRALTQLAHTPLVAGPVDHVPLRAADENSGSETGPAENVLSRGALSRLSGEPTGVTVEASVGPGGLDSQVAVEVGVPDRRASPRSEQILLQASRFPRQRVGGTPDFDTSATVAADSFRRRDRRGEGSGESAQGAGPETEEAIELGLGYLARVQTADGRWSLDGAAKQDGLPQFASDTAATGLALLAFQGAGYTHREYQYAPAIRRGLDFLVNSQKPNGDLYLSTDEGSNQVVALYSHGIAALALCEAYGMTQDPALRAPAQQALDYIAQTQHASRGGWRYAPQVGSDTSVTGWMMMALKSGELANLRVPQDTYSRIGQWLDRAQLSRSEPHLYCYNPHAPDTPEQRGGRKPTPSMTAVGLLMRLYSGWRRDHPPLIRGADYLLTTLPAIGSARNLQRDTYYWYYATQVMFHMGGSYWNAWNQRLHPLLVDSQIRAGEWAGSWDPREPVPDKWAASAGRLYLTTMNLLSLEVTYRHLPLYENTAR